jgi:N-sulfoglucosamine sulfohydrolase
MSETLFEERAQMRRAARRTARVEARNAALTRRDLLAAVGAASLAACATPDVSPAASDEPRTSEPRAPATPRHLFVFLSDDHSRIDVGCYGNRDVHTPNIDKLASQGARFERAYTPVGVCKPSRSALYTGLMPHHNGALGFDPVRADAPTWTELLKPEFCATGMIGKLNTKPVERFKFERWVRPKRVADTREVAAVKSAFEELLDAFEGRRMAIVVNLKDPHRPFRGPFEDPAYEGAPVPHDPNALSLPPHLHDTPATRQELAAYYDAIWRLDRNVGALLEVLDAKGLAQDSLVLFSSDNGQPFPFGKTTLYEAGINLPFVARWPAALAAGGVRNEFVSLIDVLPTAVDMFGATSPRAFDGRSLLPLLRDEAPAWREFIVGQHTQHLVGEPTPARSLRDERFKYIRNIRPEGTFANNVLDHSETWKSWLKAAKDDAALRDRMRQLVSRPAEELYDLVADPYELVNLAESEAHAARLASLRARLDEWMRAEGDPYATG